jgi:IS30 family transposase
MLKMKYRTRIYYTDEQKKMMWDRWQKGESMNAIGRLFDRGHSSIQGILLEMGGLPPTPSKRSAFSLTLAEREEISRGIIAGYSFQSIAMALGCAASTVSREVKRNGGKERYRASDADQAAWERAHRPKICKLAKNRALAHIVAKKLTQRWSPEQIAGWLKKTYPEDESYQVSHEIIYRSLYVQARGALKKELIKHLRTRRTMRRSRHGNRSGEGQGQIKDMISISERLASVEDRAVPGHWEGDLIVGSNDSYLATLVERHTRYVMLAKVDGKDTKTVINALIKQSKKLPRELNRSLTWDRGK